MWTKTFTMSTTGTLISPIPIADISPLSTIRSTIPIRDAGTGHGAAPTILQGSVSRLESATRTTTDIIIQSATDTVRSAPGVIRPTIITAGITVTLLIILQPITVDWVVFQLQEATTHLVAQPWEGAH